MWFSRTGNGKTAPHVGLRQLEGELLGVVVDNLRLLQQQGDEALFAASEGILCRSAGGCGDLVRFIGWRRIALLARGRVASPHVEVGTSESSSTESSIEDGIAAAALRGLRGISADVLVFCQQCSWASKGL